MITSALPYDDDLLPTNYITLLHYQDQGPGPLSLLPSGLDYDSDSDYYITLLLDAESGSTIKCQRQSVSVISDQCQAVVGTRGG